jgi:hypothetical protein
MGSTKQLPGGKVEVNEDFDLLCWDFVSNPSTQGAFMTPLNESIIKNSGADVCGKYCKSHDLMREIIIELN